MCFVDLVHEEEQPLFVWRWVNWQ